MSLCAFASMTQPLCLYFGSCGGCSAQHIEYALQIENKKTQIARSLSFDAVKVFTGKEYSYRNRMDFIFHPHGIGLRKKEKRSSIIDTETCVISNERLNQLLQEVRTFFKKPDAYDIKKHTGTLKYVVIRTPEKDSSISFVLNEDSSRRTAVEEQIKAFAEKTTAAHIVVTLVPKMMESSISEEYFIVKGTEMLQKSFLGKNFWFPIQGFFQNNDEMAEKMQEYCRTLLQKYETEKAQLLDLYGGVGTFGIINAEMFQRVAIVESVPSSVQAAEKNIQTNNVSNATAIFLDAKQLKKVHLAAPLFVITDPPRTGMDRKTVEQLNFLKPKVIIYISCNIQQTEKEIKQFEKYEIKSVALFDFFPQTPHSETVIELARKEGF